MPDQQNGMEAFKDTSQFSFTEMQLGEADLRTLQNANCACRGGGGAAAALSKVRQKYWVTKL